MSNSEEKYHDIRDPAHTVDIVPGISIAILLSTSKFADTNYITILDKEQVNMYDGNNTKVAVSRGSVVKGLQYANSTLCRVTLVSVVKHQQ